MMLYLNKVRQSHALSIKNNVQGTSVVHVHFSLALIRQFNISFSKKVGWAVKDDTTI